MHSSGICRGKIAPGTSSCLSFTFSDFFLSMTSTLLRSGSAKTLLSLQQSALHSSMFVLTRVPPNNPISACVDTFDSRLSLFFKVSYWSLWWGHWCRTLSKALPTFSIVAWTYLLSCMIFYVSYKFSINLWKYILTGDGFPSCCLIGFQIPSSGHCVEVIWWKNFTLVLLHSPYIMGIFSPIGKCTQTVSFAHTQRV